MKKRTVLITGANKSIGFETAREMGKLGFNVWLGCRDGVRGQDAVSLLLSEGIKARLAIIDVTDQESVDGCRADKVRRWKTRCADQQCGYSRNLAHRA